MTSSTESLRRRFDDRNGRERDDGLLCFGQSIFRRDIQIFNFGAETLKFEVTLCLVVFFETKWLDSDPEGGFSRDGADEVSSWGQWFISDAEFR
jgi:hypothetical protein